MADPNAPYDATTARFDVLRKRVQEDKSKALSDQEEAIKRRYAAQGMVNSGAYLKSSEEGANQVEQNAQKNIEDINFQQDAEKQRLEEVKQGREYQTSEREASQKFQSGEAQNQRIFSKELFDADMSFKQLVQSQNFGLAEKEFNASQKANQANLAIALKTAGLNDYDVENLFASAGQMLGNTQPGSSGGSSLPDPGGVKNSVNQGIDALYSSGDSKNAQFITSILKGYGYQTAMDELNKLKGGHTPTPFNIGNALRSRYGG